jgi:SAM-dependent methyltransferase
MVDDTYGPATYGDAIAEFYDTMFGHLPDTDDAVRCIASLARRGRVLELGVGTGRVALPLQQMGLEVWGVEASPAMATQLRAKPGSEHIHLVVGDFMEMPVEGSFTVIYAVYSTFFGLLSQNDQVRCFRNIASHLDPRGVFLLQAFFPAVWPGTAGNRLEVGRLIGHLRLDAIQHDPVSQTIVGSHILVADGAVNSFPVRIRYAWPTELDMMARLAGMELRHRWGGWHAEPFTMTCPEHISIYGLES